MSWVKTVVINTILISPEGAGVLLTAAIMEIFYRALVWLGMAKTGFEFVILAVGAVIFTFLLVIKIFVHRKALFRRSRVSPK